MSRAECIKIEKKIAFHSAPSLLGVKCANLVALNHSESDITTQRISPASIGGGVYSLVQ